MNKQHAVISGANSGIGRSIAESLAKEGLQVTLICRNPEKGERARDEIIEATGNQDVRLSLADLSSIAQTRRVAREIREEFPKIDVLVNNAGVYLPERLVSEDGFEMMFALNHLGYFVLAQELLPSLQNAPSARIVNVASAAHNWGHIDFDDLQCEKSFGAMKQYGTTKLANILFSSALARRLEGTKITSNAYHPGMVGTGFAQDEPGFLNFLMKIGKAFLRSPAGGARTGVYLATSEKIEGVSGEYFANRKVKRPSREARDEEVAERLWEVTESLVGSATH